MIIRQAPIVFGVLLPRLDRDGLYKIVRVVHVGDTRGNEWYSEITGINSDAQGLMPTFWSFEVKSDQ